MFKLGEKIIRPGEPFEAVTQVLVPDAEGGETRVEDQLAQFPANFLQTAGAEEIAALGIIEVPDPVRPDDRFYFVSENGDGTFTAIPKDLAMLKANGIASVKASAALILAETDWKVVRAAEGVAPLDDATKSFRASVRAAATAAEASINACNTVEALAALTITWPEAKNG